MEGFLLFSWPVRFFCLGVFSGILEFESQIPKFQNAPCRLAMPRLPAKGTGARLALHSPLPPHSRASHLLGRSLRFVCVDTGAAVRRPQ